MRRLLLFNTSGPLLGVALGRVLHHHTFGYAKHARILVIRTLHFFKTEILRVSTNWKSPVVGTAFVGLSSPNGTPSFLAIAVRLQPPAEKVGTIII
jgi:hypothetical protein